MTDHQSYLYTATNGIIGMLSSVFAVVTSFQQELEWGVRMTASCLGIIATIITIYNLLKKKRP